MNVLNDRSAPRDPSSSVLTIGFFDGVHLGHQRTIGQAIDEARARDLALIVVTFDRHPAEVARPEHAPSLLTDLAQRLELLEALGVDAVYVLEFDEAAAAQLPQDFIAQVLVAQLGCAKVIVGENFRFGAKRSGDVELLRLEGERLGFDVEGVALGQEDGKPISSTRIRALLADGDVTGARQLLGRVHELRGPVVHGDGRGGIELGCPTANLELDARLALPSDGVYAGWYRDEVLGPIPAAISVGRRPTFLEAADPIVEAHVIGFEGDLYGREAKVSFLERLRGEERFESVEALVAQMQLDVAHAAEACAASPELAPGR
jgi:riboflavin kinase/FMN adenylyltransferase